VRFDAKGFELAQQGDYAAVVEQFNQALAIDQGDYYALYNKGSALLSLGSYEAALATTNAALDYKQMQKLFNVSIFTSFKAVSGIIMTKCEHKCCGSSEKIWLPYLYRGYERGLKPHPYCVECGAVKNLSSERPREMGYYMNVIANLAHKTKISQAQVRLIVKEFERLELDDKYALDRHQQEKLFIEIAKKYLVLPEQTIRALL
jgi:tetratricopeptide (TPR) repeat protein